MQKQGSAEQSCTRRVALVGLVGLRELRAQVGAAGHAPPIVGHEEVRHRRLHGAKVLGPACMHMLAAAAHAVMIKDRVAIHRPSAGEECCMASVFSQSSRAAFTDAQRAWAMSAGAPCSANASGWT